MFEGLQLVFPAQKILQHRRAAIAPLFRLGQMAQLVEEETGTPRFLLQADGGELDGGFQMLRKTGAYQR